MAQPGAGARPRAIWQALCLGLGLLLFAGLIYGVGLAAVASALRRLGWLTPLIAIPYLASYLVDSLGWWWVLRRGFGVPVKNPGPAATPGLLQLFALRAAGEAVNAITPTAYLGGEPLKAWLLHRRGTPLVTGLASVLVSKTALMLTQGSFVFLGLLVGLHHWRSAIPLPLAAAAGVLLGILTFGIIIGVQRRGLFGILLGLSRRWSGRKALLASWEADLLAVDERLREFYGGRIRDFLICCAFHFIGWVVGSWEVYVVLWLLGSPVAFPSAFAIEALSGVAKLAAVIVPGSLGVQEGGQVVIFVAFGLGAPLAVTFGLLRRGRELLWIGFGLGVLIHHQALGWMKRRAESLEPRAERGNLGQ
ncbi:MAG: flippase-like domain-containing protein [candidate division NC10 bacterium]|nr:flippase-like domain-containing protein [candidate division NC10 bacterium]